MIRDVKEIEQSTLWEDTGRQIKNKNKNQAEDNRHNIVVVIGQRLCGKSSFIKIIKNDFDPDTKPNALVEYQWTQVGREKKHSVSFYELGIKDLLPILNHLNRKKHANIVVMLCVDLSRGRHLVTETAQLLAKLRQVTKTGKIMSSETRENHEDAQFITQMSVQVGVVSCKWDLFQKLDLQSKKWISRSLRYLAHTHSASLISSSNKNNTLSLNLRSAFMEFFLEEGGSTSRNSKDYGKPLFVKFGQDRIADMGLPSSGSMTNIEILQKQLQSAIPHDPRPKEQPQRGTDEAGEGETKLDEMLRHRRKELARYADPREGTSPSRKQLNYV